MRMFFSFSRVWRFFVYHPEAGTGSPVQPYLYFTGGNKESANRVRKQPCPAMPGSRLYSL